VRNADDSTGQRGVAARIRNARARERSLGELPTRVRSPAGAQDRLLAVLAAADGMRATGGRALTALGGRHPRLADGLRSATERAFAWRDAGRRRPPDRPGPPVD